MISQLDNDICVINNVSNSRTKNILKFYLQLNICHFKIDMKLLRNNIIECSSTIAIGDKT